MGEKGEKDKLERNFENLLHGVVNLKLELNRNKTGFKHHGVNKLKKEPRKISLEEEMTSKLEEVSDGGTTGKKTSSPSHKLNEVKSLDDVSDRVKWRLWKI